MATSLRMEALQYDRQTLALSHVRVAVPTDADKYEVILQVAYAGVCGTDLHIIEGRVPCRASPVILGHEMSGVVAEVGSHVFHVTVGDHVVVDPNRSCHTCRVCTAGMYNACQVSPSHDTVGIMRDGAFAQYCRVPADQVYRLPRDISLKQGVLCEPMSCVAHCWDRLAGLDGGGGAVAVNTSLLVSGAGIIGLLCCASAHHSGVRRIILSEPHEGRRATAKALGLDGLEVMSPEELLARRARDPGFGVDVAIDCSGAAAALQAAFELLNHQGRLVVFGIAAPEATISVSPYQMFMKELTVLGNTMNPFTFNKATGYVSGMARLLDFDKLGVRVFSLSQYEEALAQLRAGAISKAVFQITA